MDIITIGKLAELTCRVSDRFKDVEIVEKDLGNGAFLAILRGGLNSKSPKDYMDDAVSEYVKGTMYNEFVEIFLDNPWVRMIVFNFNSLEGWQSFANKRNSL